MTTDWQSLISQTATAQFLATGRLLNFRLARPDLAALAGQIAKRAPAELLDEWWAIPGVVGVRCLVHCAPLGKAIVVDEWVRESAG